ncbi:hypothetical protein [Streptomyces acidiscabies]|uniref:hypothetical protein n=1 Tax=Streptomyces acidiscabies TaxID=42234 RepID=UPI000A7F9A47|nr:hypothetical protein [Streptomyces acidiscabies]
MSHRKHRPAARPRRGRQRHDALRRNLLLAVVQAGACAAAAALATAAADIALRALHIR